jgi:hypothetical protein
LFLIFDGTAPLPDTIIHGLLLSPKQVPKTEESGGRRSLQGATGHFEPGIDALSRHMRRISTAD